MKIVVAFKWAADYQEATVNNDGEIDWSRARQVVSVYDAVAIEMARKVADAASGEVIGLSVIGEAAAPAMAAKTALARGLDRVVMVADESLRDAETTRIAEVLARAVEHIGGVDLVLAGDSSIDVAAKMVSSVAAGWLGWPAFADIGEVTAKPDNEVELTRPTSAGYETFSVTGPAVVALTADAAVARVPGMKDILGAGKKPVEQLCIADLGEAKLESIPFTVLGSTRPSHGARIQKRIDTSDKSAATAQLVGILRDAGVL